MKTLGDKPTKCQWCAGESEHTADDIHERHGAVMDPLWICSGCFELYDEVDRLLEKDS